MNKKIKTIVLLALLMALGVVLKFFSIGNGEFRISFWDIPLFLSGIIGGPIFGAITALGADLIYGLCFSSYPFSFIMMFTTVIWGVSGGVFHYLKITEKKLWVLFIVVLITSVVATIINSFYLILVYGFETMILKLPLRLLVLLIKWPITSMLIYIIYDSVFHQIKKNYNSSNN